MVLGLTFHPLDRWGHMRKSMGAFLRSQWFQTLLGLVLSGGLLVWLGMTIEWKRVAHHIGNVNYFVLIPFSLGFLFQFYCRAFRWRYLLPPSDTSLRYHFDGVMLGNFVNYILPLRLGEFARPYFLSQHSPHRFSTAFVSVVIERVLDLAIVLVFFGVMSWYLPNIPTWVHRGAIGFTIISGGLFVLLLLGSLAPAFLQNILSFFLRPFSQELHDKVLHASEGFFQGATVLKSPARLLRVFAISLFLWLVTFGHYYLLFFLFDLPANFWHAIGLTVFLALAVAAPSAPGFVGVFQVACVLAFGLFFDKQNIDTKELGTIYSILAHTAQYIVIIGYGIYLLMRYGIRLRDLRTAPPRSE